MDERMRFIARLLDGESMSCLCEEFGISRKTGYKIWNRYQNTGAYALVDRSRKPHRFGNQLPEQLERTLVKIKREKPYWGAPKIRALRSVGGTLRCRTALRPLPHSLRLRGYCL